MEENDNIVEEENVVFDDNSDETIYGDIDEERDNFESNPEAQHSTLFEGSGSLESNNSYVPPRKVRDAVLNDDGSLGRSKSLFPPRKARDAVLNDDGTLGRGKSLFPPRKARDAVLNDDGNLVRSKKPLKTGNKLLNLPGAGKTGLEHAGKGALAIASKKMPLKIKLILIGIVAALIFVIIFLIILITPLMSLGIIEVEGIGNSSSSSPYTYSSVADNTKYWWPVGSKKTTNYSGVTFADDTPSWTTITSQFGPRIHPISGIQSTHTGVDIADGSVAGTTNIIAARDGIVVYPSSSDNKSCPTSSTLDSCGGGYGNYVMIQHSDGNITLYAHLYENSITVTAGDSVKQGQVIGKMGSSGNSTGTHLHFEVRENGSAVNPLNFVSIDNPRPKVNTVNNISGNSNKESVCLTLKSTGFSNNAVAALMTNINFESSFNPTNIGDNGTSYGLCQWHNGRYDNLRTIYPDSYHTVGSQIEYLIYELENKYVGVHAALLDESNSVSDMTNKFCTDFERPADTVNTCRNRANNSNSFYSYVVNGCK